MIGIKINNEWLDVPENIALKFEFNSNFLLENSFIQKSNYSFPIKIPLTNKNNRLLNFNHRVENQNYEAITINENIFLVYASSLKAITLKIIRFTKEEAVATIYTGISNFEDLVNNKKLPEFNYGEYEFLTRENKLYAFALSGTTGGTVELKYYITDDGNTTYYTKTFNVTFENSINYTLNKIADLINAEYDLGSTYDKHHRAKVVGNYIIIYVADITSGSINYLFYTDGIATPGTNGMWNWMVQEQHPTNFPTGTYSYRESMQLHINLHMMAHTVKPVMDHIHNVASNVDPVYPESTHCFPTIYAPDLTNDADYKGYLNNFSGALPTSTVVNPIIYQNGYYAMNYLIPNYVEPTNSYKLAPQVYLFHILDVLFKASNINYDGSFFDIPELKKLIVLNTNIWESEDIERTDLNERYDNWHPFLYLNEHVPDVTVFNFLNSLRKTFFLYYDFDSNTRTIKFEFLRDIINDKDYIDFTDNIVEYYSELSLNDKEGIILKYDFGDDSMANEQYREFGRNNYKGVVTNYSDLSSLTPENGDIWLVAYEDKYYIWRLFDDGSTYGYHWDYYSDNILPLKINNSTTDLTMDFSPVLVKKRESLSAAHEWLVPGIKMQGYSRVYNEGSPNISLKLLFMRGTQPQLPSGNYPFATPYWTNINEEYLGDYSLSIEGDLGIYPKFGKEYCDFLLRTKRVKCVLDVDKIDILNFDFSKKIKIQNSSFFVEQIKVTVNSNRKIAFFSLLKL